MLVVIVSDATRQEEESYTDEGEELALVFKDDVMASVENLNELAKSWD